MSPEHAPDIVVYVDAITIVSEEASKGGQSVSLPIVCVEAGSDHSLPNLALRSLLCVPYLRVHLSYSNTAILFLTFSSIFLAIYSSFLFFQKI